MDESHSLDRTFAALADPTRRAILARLAAGEAGVLDIAAPFAMSQPAISRHLKVLQDAGLVLRRIDGTRRPARLAPGSLAALENWAAMMRRAMEANFARLDDVLKDMKEEKS